jgi:hypothetical protein
MTIDRWLESALADADRRGLPALRPLLEGLARATRALREADLDASPAAVTAPPPRRSGSAAP